MRVAEILSIFCYWSAVSSCPGENFERDDDDGPEEDACVKFLSLNGVRKAVAAFPCSEPQKRLVKVEELAGYENERGTRPRGVMVHRCDYAAGSCEGESECISDRQSEEIVVMEIVNENKIKMNVTVVNHTMCVCGTST